MLAAIIYINWASIDLLIQLESKEVALPRLRTGRIDNNFLGHAAPTLPLHRTGVSQRKTIRRHKNLWLSHGTAKTQLRAAMDCAHAVRGYSRSSATYPLHDFSLRLCHFHLHTSGGKFP